MASLSKSEKGVTLIANNTEIVGDIRFSDQFFVSGKVVGNILAEEDKATLVVGEGGTVSGEIRVPNAVVNGRVEGDLYVSKKVELAANAHIQGSVYYRLIEMELGAVIEGRLIHAEQPHAQDVDDSASEQS